MYKHKNYPLVPLYPEEQNQKLGSSEDSNCSQGWAVSHLHQKSYLNTSHLRSAQSFSNKPRGDQAVPKINDIKACITLATDGGWKWEMSSHSPLRLQNNLHWSLGDEFLEKLRDLSEISSGGTLQSPNSFICLLCWTYIHKILRGNLGNAGLHCDLRCQSLKYERLSDLLHAPVNISIDRQCLNETFFFVFKIPRMKAVMLCLGSLKLKQVFSTTVYGFVQRENLM